MIDISNFVFFDIETTGLNFNEHQILELSYAVGDGEIITLYVTDMDFEKADPKALKVNKYFERFAGEGYGQWYPVNELCKDLPGVRYNGFFGVYEVYLALPISEDEEWDKFFDEVLPGKTLVGANPGFDRAFLEMFIGSPLKANYRLFDVQAFAAGRAYVQALDSNGMFNDDRLQDFFDAWVKFPSLKELCIDFNVEPGDHTSAGDVRATREVWKKLVGLA